jgi:HlyD family secretion protein
MKKALAIGGIVLLVLVLIVASLATQGDEEGSGVRRGKGEKVYVETASIGELQRDVSATGQLQPRESVQLSAEVLGKVEQILVSAGDEVTEGQLLLRIDRGALLEDIESLQAQVRMDRIAIESAGLRLSSAATERDRITSLHERGIVSDATRDEVGLAWEQARVETDATRERLTQSEARLRALRNDLDKTEVRAPMTGTVLLVQREPGEGVAPGMGGVAGTSLALIGDLSEVRILVEIEEAEVALVRVGQEASVEVDALEDREFHATVVELAVQGTTGRRGVVVFDAELRIDDPDEALRAGMTARVDIHVEHVEGTLVIPLAAVLEDADDNEEYVFVERDGAVHRTSVTTGLSNDTHIVVLGGLDAGARVVTGPYRVLKDLEDDDAVRAELEAGDDDDSADPSEAEPEAGAEAEKAASTPAGD